MHGMKSLALVRDQVLAQDLNQEVAQDQDQDQDLEVGQDQVSVEALFASVHYLFSLSLLFLWLLKTKWSFMAKLCLPNCQNMNSGKYIMS